jgi:hypothetical protein
MDDFDFNCHFDKKDGLNQEDKDFLQEASLAPFKPGSRKLGISRQLV